MAARGTRFLSKAMGPRLLYQVPARQQSTAASAAASKEQTPVVSPPSKGFRMLEARGVDEAAWVDDLGFRVDKFVRTKEGGRVAAMEHTGEKELLDFCKNSYLGLSSHPEVIQAGIDAIKEYGAGIGSVRTGHGTFQVHLDIEKAIVEFHDRDPAEWGCALFSSGYQANVGFFGEFLSSDDIIISDELVHGCVIDGMRLSTAKRTKYKNNDMEELEQKLKENMDKKMRLIATDGVFSMDGTTCPLRELKELAVKYDATVFMDDSHGLGLVGPRGRGTEDYKDCIGAADVIASSVCKGLTPQGGYMLAPKKCIDIMFQRNRPFLFSSALPPASSASLLKAFQICVSEEGDQLRANIRRLAKKFRTEMKKNGFVVYGDEEIPICPVVFDNMHTCIKFGSKLIENGIIILSVVPPSAPPDTPRIRTVIAGHHTEEDIDRCIETYLKVRDEMGLTK